MNHGSKPKTFMLEMDDLQLHSQHAKKKIKYDNLIVKILNSFPQDYNCIMEKLNKTNGCVVDKLTIKKIEYKLNLK